MDLMTLLAIFCLLMVAVAFSPLGLGGGILYVPIMHYMLDWEIKEAIVASLTLVLMVSLGSSLAHSKSGHVEPSCKMGAHSSSTLSNNRRIIVWSITVGSWRYRNQNNRCISHYFCIRENDKKIGSAYC